MKIGKLIYFICLTSILLIDGCKNCDSPGAESQTLTIKPQETNSWGWAAVTEMITTFLGHGETQCELANQKFGKTNCCQSEKDCPKNLHCNMPGWTMFSESGFDFKSSSSPLSWNAIKEQIYCNKQPLSYAYGQKSGGIGHVVVIYGYAEVGGEKYLLIKDPWEPCKGNDRIITYQSYNNEVTTSHWETDYAFKYMK